MNAEGYLKVKLDNGYLWYRQKLSRERCGDGVKEERHAYKAMVFDMVVQRGLEACPSSHGTGKLSNSIHARRDAQFAFLSA